MERSNLKKIVLLIFLVGIALSGVILFISENDYNGNNLDITDPNSSTFISNNNNNNNSSSSSDSNISNNTNSSSTNSGSNSNSNSNNVHSNTDGNKFNDFNYESSGLCDYVVDGDTLDVVGVGRIRLVGVNTPERGEIGYKEATDFLKSKCLGKKVYLDIDDKKNKDKYGRILAIVYVDGQNINQELLRQGFAEIMFIPPSEFNPYDWT